MDGVKSFLASKTIWGSVIAVVALGLGFLGYTFGAEDQAVLVEAVIQVVGVVGAIIAIYGRVTATKTIG